MGGEEVGHEDGSKRGMGEEGGVRGTERGTGGKRKEL